MADLLSLKWIEGNTDTTGGVSLQGTPTFNIDDPTMWPTLSVMSGLASGFCERRATLDDDFVTAAGTTLHWSAGTAANRDTIAKNCMHNMALGSSGAANLYKTATDATMYPIGSAGASNYMVAMDNAITTLVGDMTKFVSSGTTPAAYTFDTLKAAAATAATNAGSAITTITSNGGSFNTKMALATPVMWAKQRKWMLDELKYTSQTAVYDKPVASCNIKKFNETVNNKSLLVSVEACRLDEYGSGTTTAISDLAFAGGAVTSIISPTYYTQNYVGRCFFYIMAGNATTGQNGVWSFNGWKPRYYYSDQAYGSDYSWPFPGDNVLWATVPQDTALKAATVKVLFDQGSIYKDTDTYAYMTNVHRVSTTESVTGADTAGNSKSYEIKTGGILTIPNGQKPLSVVISSGGKLIMENGSLLSHCILLSGGALTGIPNIMDLSVDGFYPYCMDTPTIQLPFGADVSSKAITSTYTALNADTVSSASITDKAYYISGHTFTYAHPTTLDGLEVKAKECHFIVDNGGVLVMSGVAQDDRAVIESSYITVLSGGTVSMSSHSRLYDTEVYVYSGGSLNLRHVASAYEASVEGGNLYLAPGAVVSAYIKPSSPSDYDAQHIPTPAHLHFRKDGITADSTAANASLHPNITVTWENVGTGPNSEAVFYHTYLYIFNGNGIVLNGASESVVQGYQSFNTTLGSAGTPVYLAGSTETLAPIDDTNSPLKKNAAAGDVTLNSIPYIGYEGTDVIYRCSIVSIDIETASISDHYQDFYVRQFNENQDNA